MEPAQSYEEVAAEAADHTIYDLDFHLHVSSEALLPFMDDAQIRRKIEEFGPPGKKGSGVKMAYATEDKRKRHERAQGEAVDREEVREVCDAMKIDVPVVTPGTHFRLAGTTYDTMKTAIARAYNDYAIEHVLDPDEGIYGAFALPKWDVDAALEEIERVADIDGFVAAQNYFGNPKMWGHVDHDPIFDELTARELPLLLHSGGGGAGLAHISDSYSNRLEWEIPKKCYNALSDIMNMITHGVFDKYPNLTVILQEANGPLWVPYVAYAADELLNAHHKDFGLSRRMKELGQNHLQHAPSHYVFENFFVTTQPITLPPTTRETKAMMELCRAREMFIFSTDWPHLTVDTADWLFEHNFDDELKENVLHRNAERAIPRLN